ncbi:uncharacterized protein LOC122403156 [Colletes gigas]|uniref:uncharacterized protein LOC122403156 n=1 Tax=Colletes gigas TaxID=935657 RepID=UPI001C9AD914|nr:uncharacterized protein LOC122403156 [Colletes gigas]
MTEDILHRIRTLNNNAQLNYTEEMYNEALILTEDMCLGMASKALAQLGMPSPNRSRNDIFNQDLLREQNYDPNVLTNYVQENIPKLNQQQKLAYEKIMQEIDNGNGGMYFLDAPGGTGKTFLITLILATVRARGRIALALASSGIAATLLDGGRTAHSALKLPLNMTINEAPSCNLSKTSGMARVLKQFDILLWDECTMAHKKSIEALDRTMRDFRGNQNIFGGALILLAGDFRQTLPVISKSTPADEINACLKLSNLWRYVKTLRLTTNVRVQLQNDQSAVTFSKQLLLMGDGKMPIDNDGFITIPRDFCIFTQSKEELIEKVFPNIQEQYKNHAWLSERAILAGKNKDVNVLNFIIQSQIDGELITYKSVDTVKNQEDVVHYPTEFLNSLDLPGMPPHNLQLKIGSTIIMLRVHPGPPTLSPRFMATASVPSFISNGNGRTDVRVSDRSIVTKFIQNQKP